MPIGCGIRFAGNRISDHNRSPIGIDYSKQEYRKRMANGTMRRVFVVEKRSFKFSWSMLPAENKRAVDGFWAAKALKAFYLANNGSFTMRITYGDNTFEDVLVMMTSFNMALIKRSSYGDMYDVDLSIEEV